MTLEYFNQWKDNFMHSKDFIAAENFSIESDKKAIMAPEYTEWYRCLDIDPTKIHTIITFDSVHPFNYCADGLALSSLDEATPAMNKLYEKIYKDLGYEYDYEDNCKEKWLERGCLCLPMQLTRTSGKRTLVEYYWVDIMFEYLKLFLYDNQPRAFLLLDQFQDILPIDYKKTNDLGHLILISKIKDLLTTSENYFEAINNFIKKNYDLNMIWT